MLFPTSGGLTNSASLAAEVLGHATGQAINNENTDVEKPIMPVRKIAAVTLAVSFLAMSTSGMMMFVIEKPSFTIQMHPVHKLFGLLMIIAAIAHLFYNYRSLLNHLRSKSVAVYGCVLVVCLVLLYGVVAYNRVPAELAAKMDEAAEQAH